MAGTIAWVPRQSNRLGLAGLGSKSKIWRLQRRLRRRRASRLQIGNELRFDEFTKCINKLQWKRKILDMDFVLRQVILLHYKSLISALQAAVVSFRPVCAAFCQAPLWLWWHSSESEPESDVRSCLLLVLSFLAPLEERSTALLPFMILGGSAIINFKNMSESCNNLEGSRT